MGTTESQLTPFELPQLTLKPIFTGKTYHASQNGHVGWTRMVQRMEGEPYRRQLVVDAAVEQAAAGHFVLIPVCYLNTVDHLVEAINEQAGELIARAFTGRSTHRHRAELLTDANAGKFKVLIGSSRLAQFVGCRIDRASCLIDRMSPTNRPDAARHRVGHILRRCPDKPAPLIIMLLDKGLPLGLTRNEFHGAYRQFNPIISNEDGEAIQTFLISDKPYSKYGHSRKKQS